MQHTQKQQEAEQAPDCSLVRGSLHLEGHPVQYQDTVRVPPWSIQMKREGHISGAPT